MLDSVPSFESRQETHLPAAGFAQACAQRQFASTSDDHAPLCGALVPNPGEEEEPGAIPRPLRPAGRGVTPKVDPDSAHAEPDGTHGSCDRRGLIEPVAEVGGLIHPHGAIDTTVPHSGASGRCLGKATTLLGYGTSIQVFLPGRHSFRIFGLIVAAAIGRLPRPQRENLECWDVGPTLDRALAFTKARKIFNS